MLVIPLGERPHAAVADAVRQRFGHHVDGANRVHGGNHVECGAGDAGGEVVVDWLDRTDFRRRPWQTLRRLLHQPYDDAVLVAPDLQQRRLRLTSLVLLLPRARRRHRIDLHGAYEAFRPRHYLRTSGPVAVRHLLACGLARIVGYPILRLLDRLLQSSARPVHRLPRPQRMLYLRAQFWFGLEGGGSVTHTAGVIGGLEQAGVGVNVVSSDRLPGVRAPVNVVTPETWFDGSLRELEELAYNVPFTLHALRLARRCRPHAIYQRHTAFSVAGAVLSRLLALPLILEFNSSEVWKAQHWGGIYHLRVASLVERINLTAASHIVVVSNALRQDLLRQGVPPVRIVVNPNGVDPSAFRPDVDARAIRARLGIAPDQTVIGFSGTFGVWHGIPALAGALPSVLQMRPDTIWLLIGDGALRPLIDQTVAQHHLEDRVRRPGLVSHAAMPAYLAACDILVSPHGQQVDGGEFFGSPTKLYEYMASGRPIVASAVGQIADVVRDGDSALLVPPDDPAALVQAILRLVDDPCLRQHLADRARRAVEAHHTWRHNAERLLAALETR